MASSLYWRELTRNGTPDVDHVADAAFLSDNFVDWFGKWLQDGNNASLYTLDELITVFWSKFCTTTSRHICRLTVCRRL
jgi:hypothetical protein